jgi:hypothetical protein
MSTRVACRLSGAQQVSVGAAPDFALCPGSMWSTLAANAVRPHVVGIIMRSPADGVAEQISQCCTEPGPLS